MSVKQWMKSFLSEMKVMNKSPHTIRNYSYDLDQFLLYIRNHKLPIQMDTATFKETSQTYFYSLVTYYNEDRKVDLNYDEASINRKRSTMRSFIRFLYRLHYISEDFSDEIEFTRNALPPKQVLLTSKEISKIFLILDQRIHYGKTEDLKFMHRRNKLAFITLLQTGIKVSELLLLKWGNIHLDKGYIVIPKRNTIETRTIPLSRSLSNEFEEYLYHLQKLEHFAESFLSGFIFFGAGKTPTYAVNPKTIERMIDSLASEACIHNKNVTSQSLRHTMANVIMEHHNNIYQLTPLLGYSRNSVTKHMYQKTKE